MRISNYIYQDLLHSPRLKTRFLTRDDIVKWTAFFKDEEAIALMPTYGLNTNEEKATRWIEKQLDRYATNRMGHQALIDIKTNAFIGQAGLLVQEVDGIAELEVGYHVFKKYWGQGYAPEAARLFLNHAFENNLSDSVISIIDTRNIKSQRVAMKNGLQVEKQTTWSDLNVYIYRIQKANWK
ncbi:MAG: GNAT family N-acetyltransferase [Saprospiraceae bacterium]